MKCPKCNKEYNTMEEVVKCLSQHIETEKKNAEEIRKEKRDKEIESIKRCFNEISNTIDKFNTTYPEIRISKPLFKVTTVTHGRCNNINENFNENYWNDLIERIFN